MTDHLLITGANSGIGAVLAHRLADQHPLLLHGHDPERLASLFSAIPRNDRHRFWCCDFDQPESISKSLTALLLEGVSVSRVVHLAGVVETLPLRLFDASRVRHIFNVNVLSSVEILRTLTNQNLNGDRLRSVVLVSSVAAFCGVRGYSVYGASKSALDAVMRALSRELAPGIRVNSVLPGGIRTPATEGLYASPEFQARVQAEYPMGPGRPEDVCAAIEFLLFDQTRHVTGQSIVVDGGYSVR